MIKITRESKDETNTITIARGFKTCPVLLHRIHEETEPGDRGRQAVQWAGKDLDKSLDSSAVFSLEAFTFQGRSQLPQILESKRVLLRYKQ